MAPQTIRVSAAGGFDSSGDPVAAGSAITLRALEIAPGNTAAMVTPSGELDIADFTVYLPLRCNVNGSLRETDALVRDDDMVTVRGRVCQARVQKWSSGGRGGVVVLCKSVTGAS